MIKFFCKLFGHFYYSTLVCLICGIRIEETEKYRIELQKVEEEDLIRQRKLCERLNAVSN